MKKLSNEKKEQLKKLNDTFLFNVGYHHMNNICDETDRLLEEYKDLEVPDSLDQWFIHYTKELKRKERNRKIRSKAVKLSKRIATVLLVISIAGSVVTLSVEALRVDFFNLVIQASQKFSLVFQEEINEEQMVYEVPNDWIDYYYPTYLPDDYFLMDTRTLIDTKYMTFSNLDGQELRFIQGNLSARSQIDTENGKVIEVDIRGSKGVLVVKDDISILNWSTNGMSFTIQGNVKESVLLAIAESVEKNK
jgi:hypothetical protein